MQWAGSCAYIGTDERPESENEGWCLSTSSRSRDSRDSSLSTEGILTNETDVLGSKECCAEWVQTMHMVGTKRLKALQEHGV